MLNILYAILFIILWFIIFLTKPYYYAETKFWTNFWVIIFCMVGGICGVFISQSIIYLCGGNTIL